MSVDEGVGPDWGACKDDAVSDGLEREVRHVRGNGRVVCVKQEGALEDVERASRVAVEQVGGPLEEIEYPAVEVPDVLG